jgi:hypothetical protein
MKFGSKILGLLVIAALLVATLATRSLALAVAVAIADHAPSAAVDERPAGCHAHGGPSLPLSPLPRSPLPHSPLPAPVSYQCCLTGHNAAVVRAFTAPQPPAQCQDTRVTLQIQSALTASFLGGWDFSMLLSADPPGTTALRI